MKRHSIMIAAVATFALSSGSAHATTCYTTTIGFTTITRCPDIAPTYPRIEVPSYPRYQPPPNLFTLPVPRSNTGIYPYGR